MIKVRYLNQQDSIKKRNANCLAFFEVFGFLNIKTSRNAKCNAFCIYINANSKNFMKNRVTESVWLFVNKNVTQIVLLFAKCLSFCIYIYKFLNFFAFSIYKNVQVVFCCRESLLFIFM